MRKVAAPAQRKDDALTEAEGEGQRRGPGEQVGEGWPQHMAREGVRDGKNVAVEMHGGLRLPRRARRERKQANIVRGGLHVLEVGRLAHGELREVARAGAAVRNR